MENYERLTIELLGNDLTPKAKYELVKHLLAIKELYSSTKKCLESDIDWFGNSTSEYKNAVHYYEILNGTIKFQPDHRLKNCEHTGDEIIKQGDGFVYKKCADCGADI